MGDVIIPYPARCAAASLPEEVHLQTSNVDMGGLTSGKRTVFYGIVYIFFDVKAPTPTFRVEFSQWISFFFKIS